jgi:hypothetical protein
LWLTSGRGKGKRRGKEGGSYPVNEGHILEEHLFPKFDYYLDESDPDILLLRRQDGAFVAAFSAQGAIKEGIVQAAREDYEALIRENAADHVASEKRRSA